MVWLDDVLTQAVITADALMNVLKVPAIWKILRGFRKQCRRVFRLYAEPYVSDNSVRRMQAGSSGRLITYLSVELISSAGEAFSLELLVVAEYFSPVFQFL